MIDNEPNPESKTTILEHKQYSNLTVMFVG